MVKRLLIFFISFIVILSFVIPCYAVTDYVAVNDRQIISLAYYTDSCVFDDSSQSRFIGTSWSVPYGSSSFITYGGQTSFYVQRNINMIFDVYLPFGGIIDIMIPASFTIDSVSYEDSDGVLTTDSTLVYWGYASDSYVLQSGSSRYNVRTYSITCNGECQRLIFNCSTLNTGTQVVVYAYGGLNAFNPSPDSNIETILDNIRVLLENDIAVDLESLKKYTYSILSKIDDVEAYVDSCRQAFQKCLDRADYSSALNYATVIDTIYSTYIDISDSASDYFRVCIAKDLFDVFLLKAQNDYSKILADKYKVSGDDSDSIDKYSEAEKAVFDSFSMAQFESLTSYDQYLLKLDTEQASFLKQIYDLIINSEFGQAFVIVPLSFSLMALVLGAPVRSSVKVENSIEVAPNPYSNYDYYDKTDDYKLGSGNQYLLR